MKKTIVVLPLLALLLMPSAASARTGSGNVIADVDKLQVESLNAKFTHIRTDLSQLRANLRSVSSSMTAHESVQLYLIRRSYEDLRNMEGICRFMESFTNRLAHVEADKRSYYCNAQEYSIEQMRGHSNECLSDLKEIRSEISITPALTLIDAATEKIHSASVLLDKVVNMLQQCSPEEEPHLHHEEEPHPHH